jgi:hypothetical protein
MRVFLHRCVGVTTSPPFSVASVLALGRVGRSSASKLFGRTERASSTLVMSRKAVRVRSSALCREAFCRKNRVAYRTPCDVTDSYWHHSDL